MAAHAKLAPSSAHRWMRCPGSVRLCQGYSDTTSIYAAEGTAAHELAAECLAVGADAASFLGRAFGGFTNDETMVAAVQVYLDAVRCIEWLDDAATTAVERKVRLSDDVYGTADAVVHAPPVLHVFDYKHGAGVFVDVNENEQTMIYGAAALAEYPDPATFREVHLHIVQPRYTGARPWRTAKLPASRLREFAREVRFAAEATKDPNAGLSPGDHCKWCPALADCPAVRAQARELAQHAFAEPVEPAVPKPETLSAGAVGWLLTRFPVLESWMSAVRARAFALAMGGTDVPGHKLVAGRSNRKWRSEDEAVELLRANGVEPFESSVLSPAQAEKALGKAKASLVEPLTHKPAASPVLVEDSDRRPAIARGDVFLTVPES